MARIFLSYVFEEYRYAAQVRDWANNGQLGNYVEIVTESEDVRRHGQAAIWTHLRSKMREADGVIVLIGHDSHNHDWVHQEVHYFASSGKPIIGVRLPNTYGAAPPEIRNRLLWQYSPGSLYQAISSIF